MDFFLLHMNFFLHVHVHMYISVFALSGGQKLISVIFISGKITSPVLVIVHMYMYSVPKEMSRLYCKMHPTSL